MASSADQLQWLQQAIATAKKWKLKGLIWFQADKEKKWALRLTPEQAQAIQTSLR